MHRPNGRYTVALEPRLRLVRIGTRQVSHSLDAPDNVRAAHPAADKVTFANPVDFHDGLLSIWLDSRYGGSGSAYSDALTLSHPRNHCSYAVGSFDSIHGQVTHGYPFSAALLPWLNTCFRSSFTVMSSEKGYLSESRFDDYRVIDTSQCVKDYF